MGKSDWVLLESQIDGHYIARSSPGFRQRFQLTSRDRLISVNEEDICHLSHNDVVRRMCDVIRMECKQSLAIERHRHTEDEEYIEIMRLDISLEFLDEDGGDTMVNFTARLLRKITRHFRVIYNLEWKNKLKCWISHFSEGKQKYLCSRDDSDELTLAHLPNIEDPRFQFSRDTYHGFRRDGCDNKGLYLVTLMCKATDGYISVGTSGGVKLKRYVNDTKGMTSVSHPLPQMFICRMYKDGKYNLESLNHEGCLLRWSTRKKMIEIKEVDDDEYNGRNRPEFLFSIYTDASKVV
ncbi:uncharacterized protein LOC117342263 [Pecten maximus]|uniref:uncharacterized protein LOC117342263 n=1 Tax=Pecten maximus TaxID=6579 RepID=UPI00145849EE|nr:uncharacterized protein LOC117342263 [Pecten maximus]